MLWFFIFFEFYAHILESWSNPRFDKDLNTFKTWKRKGKLVSLLISHSNMKFLGGFWNFHVWNPKPLLFKLDFIRQSLRLGGRYMICMVWICPNLVNASTWMLTIWHKKTMYFGFSFFCFFWILCPFESFGQILGLTKI